MPMPRLFGVFACLVLVLSTFLGQLIMPRPAAAATVTATSDAELRSGPGYDQPVVTMVFAGTSLALNGPPENEFYPVTVNGQTGWIHGAVLHFVKDAAPEAELAATTPETTAYAADAGAPNQAEAAPVAVAPESGTAAPVSAWDPQQAAQEVPVGDQAATEPPPATTVPTDGTSNTGQPPADGAVTNSANGADGQISNGAPPVDPAATGDGSVPADGATGTATAPADQGVTSAATTPVPTTPEPTPAPTGNATVPGGGNLFQNPDASSYVLFWVPAGSTVWRLGETRNGFVHVDYMAMVGWMAADQLTEPVAVMAEVVPETAPRADNVRTPRPGSGVAFTTVELNLRAGPSASEASLTVVPAGARVVMTGVMENGFHRVDYRGTLGWLASDYLSTPPDPTAVPASDTAVGGRNNNRNNNRNGNRNNNRNNNRNSNRNATTRNQKSYTRDEIISIIYAAADRYGQDRADMLRVAECESALDPYAVHPSGSYGLYQFIRTTWKSTPYGDQSMFDPTANANAAGWMWAQGRRSEWVCK